ncbi:hypothetical protein AB6A40_005669 [Gnathostoma spinigerum]|uniref:Serine aminopeptidase S33 domain-containing protein n=1 Tax=Gnathostoma spinigerum TaxID=75299 RepID=A0ABD6ERS1_9BILA
MQAIGLVCYIVCPPIPECISRKLAFHPPPKGYSYVLRCTDHSGNCIETTKIKKAIKYASVKVKPKKLFSFCSPSMERIETTILKTQRNSLIVSVWVKNRIHLTTKNRREKNLVLIFSQPNSSDLGCYVQPMGMNLRWLSDVLDMDVYAYDYTGYGISSGRATEKNMYSDIQAVYGHVLKTRGPNVKIALLGYSIGTVPTSFMAATHPTNLAGVVLVAPLTSGLRLFCNKPEQTTPCCLDRFKSYERAADIEVPVLICHGGKDNVIPIAHGLQLQQRLKRAVEPVIVEDADHLSIFSGRYLSVFHRIRDFLHRETDI